MKGGDARSFDTRTHLPVHGETKKNMARFKYERTKKDCIYKYKDTADKTKYAFRYKYLDQYKQRKEKSGHNFNSIEDAERALIKIKAEVLEGNLNFVEQSNITLAKWIPIFMESKKRTWRESTYKLYKRNFDKFIIPALGHMKLTAITKMAIQRNLIDKMKDDGHSKGHIVTVTRNLLAAINSAVSEQILKYNPVKGLDYGQAEKKSENFFNEDELSAFLTFTHEYDPTTYYTMFLTFALSGLRKGELYGLKYSDVDFVEHTITVSRQRENDYVGPPKTENSYRTIKVNKKLIKQLQLYKLWVKKELFKRKKQLNEDDFIFVDRYNFKPVGKSYANDALRRILESCPADLPEITPHGFRHTFASILIANNVPPVTVANLIGDHVNTLNVVYAHSFASTEEKTVALFDHIKLVK